MNIDACVLSVDVLVSNFHWYVEKGGDRNVFGMVLENTFDKFLKPIDNMRH